MSIMEGVLLLVALAVGFALGMMRGKQLLAGAVGRPDYDKAVQERATFAAKLENARETLESTQRELTVYRERAVTAEAENKSLQVRLKEQQEQLRHEFSNTANTIVKNISKEFSTQSEKKIGDLLNPLQLKLNDFQKLVHDSFTAQGKEQHTLKSEIEKMVLQTDSLTKALRGDVKAQGNWGEIMLERILEESGLRKGEDYILQGAEMGLTGAEGNRLQPDVIVRLPDNKHIIVDSKVSLTDYERFCGERDDGAREMHLRSFLRSVKNHVNGLESKRYQDIDQLGTPDFVFMFMPIEGAYSLAMQNDPELTAYAWSKNIVIIPPTNLFANLRTIASLWRIESQNRNAQEIARVGGALYDKIAGYLEDMMSVGKHIERLEGAYDQAMNKLSKGRGNIVNQADKLKELGAKTSKSLPKTLQLEDREDIEEIVAATDVA